MPLFRNFLFLIGVVQSVFTATSSVSRVYERPEEGFCYQADHYPFGKGLNVQIRDFLPWLVLDWLLVR